MCTGIIKTWDASRAFGFISPDGGGTPVAAHRNQLRMQASEFHVGMRVGYSIGSRQNDMRPEAKEIRPYRKVKSENSTLRQAVDRARHARLALDKSLRHLDDPFINEKLTTLRHALNQLDAIVGEAGETND